MLRSQSSHASLAVIGQFPALGVEMANPLALAKYAEMLALLRALAPAFIASVRIALFFLGRSTPTASVISDWSVLVIPGLQRISFSCVSVSKLPLQINSCRCTKRIRVCGTFYQRPSIRNGFQVLGKIGAIGFLVIERCWVRLAKLACPVKGSAFSRVKVPSW
jgi:hypothetical protein